MMVNSVENFHVRVAIIGSGFSGLGTAIRLKQHGMNDFVVLERAGEVGGTWRDNRYPGCACDVESHLYSFSFAPNPKWSRLFSAQPEILDYLKDCAERFGISPHLRFHHEVLEARWIASSQLWQILTSRGTFTARFLVCGTGALSEPAIPQLLGLESFRGKRMHSAQWDPDYPLAGKRVAVIGTGASAIQFVPEIQPKVSQLFLFQRTAPWVVPSMDRPITEPERNRFQKYPLVQKYWRLRTYLFREAMGVAFRYPWLMAYLERAALRYLRQKFPDPEFRRKLIPNYRIGCKRILISKKYYPAIAQKNVELVTEAIQEVRPESIVTSDGVERPVDAIIFGTGFRVTEMVFASRIRGREGKLLSEVWEGSPRGHLGTTMVGFPNLFFLMGPNTGLGHNSVVMLIESQIEHCMNALAYLERKNAVEVEPRIEAEIKFNDELKRRMKGTVWVSGGCSSWYLDRHGRNTTLWPGSVGAFRRRVERFRSSEYRVS